MAQTSQGIAAASGDVIAWGGEVAQPRAELDICIVGINRPELLELTLRSFFKRLLHQWKSVRIVANIDPLPAPAARETFLPILMRFAQTGLVRLSRTPSFAAAVSWVWSNSHAPVVFHLEDDWLCLTAIDRRELQHALSALQAPSVQLLLPKSSSSRDTRLAGFSLNPSFIDGEWVRRIGPKLLPEYDPEKQIRHGLLCLEHESAPQCVVVRGSTSGPVVFDTGTLWKRAVGMRKELTTNQKVDWKLEARKGASMHRLALACMSGIDTFGPFSSRGIRAVHAVKDSLRGL
jgi:hypothetical protein